MYAIALPLGRRLHESGGMQKIKGKLANVSLLLTLLAITWFCNFVGSALSQNATSGLNTKEFDISVLQKLAERGDAKAAYLLGRSYMVGSGVSQNNTQAAKWLLQAATQGLPDAEFALAYLYEHGAGVPRDYKRAFSYYEAAARQGHSTAQNNLASMYEHGEGIRRNIDEAKRWYHSAAGQGNAIAECNLASLHFRQQEYAEALTWFKAAAQSSDPTAQEDLAWMYYTGTGTTPDYSEAAKWVRLAAEQAIPRAQLDLGYLYEQGKGVPLDYVAAYAWYKAASTGGEKRAISRLKNIGHIMTPDQISKADIAAAKMPKSSRGVGSESAQPIGSSFVDSR